MPNEPRPFSDLATLNPLSREFRQRLARMEEILYEWMSVREPLEALLVRETPEFLTGGGVPRLGVVSHSEQRRENVWRYFCHYTDFDAQNETAFAQTGGEMVICYNWLEVNNFGTSGNYDVNTGVTVGPIGVATVTLKPLKDDCPVVIFPRAYVRNTGGTGGGGIAGEIIGGIGDGPGNEPPIPPPGGGGPGTEPPGEPETVYLLYPLDNAVRVVCNAPKP